MGASATVHPGQKAGEQVPARVSGDHQQHSINHNSKTANAVDDTVDKKASSKSRASQLFLSTSIAKTLLEKYNSASPNTAADGNGVDPSTVDRYGFIKSKKNQHSYNLTSDTKRTPLLRRVAHPTDVVVRAPSALTPSRPLSVERETRRQAKWQAMAKAESTSPGSTVYSFQIDNTLISRTYKGIPDAWRSAAWYSSITYSARKEKNFVTDEQLLSRYDELLTTDSSADNQIDLDVPRTIAGHVLFSARYSGGQRLLFRVLHAFSLTREDVGYVQGMAPLAATLLCYYDERTAYIMMCRLFSVRHFDILYAPGFGGLFDAFEVFKTALEARPAGRKILNLGIDPMLFATKWYLTLFHYALQFPMQLRIWDVFFLGPPNGDSSVAATFNILHATALAIVDVFSATVLSLDFEHSLTLLSTIVDVKNPDLFMRVVKQEYNGLSNVL
ncbi:rab-GTPase-TBC domain-containing protein [Lipomyces oligophaga]|uniref:rab-GTPase-TBC domain-containing protein n=1 Tax=Lipomyces oligophaga TaxID=45792 RepID=UPI0034CF4D1F